MADALLLVLASRSALAEGTRTLHPAGAPGERGVMDVSDASSIHSLTKGRGPHGCEGISLSVSSQKRRALTHSIARTARWSDGQLGAGGQGVSIREVCNR